MPTVQTNGVETYYVEHGDGPPVVFVHGAIVDHTQWAPQLDALSGDYRTVGYDVRGHGRTGGSPEESYSIELFAEDLDALADALDLDQFVLVGLSMGGLIAQGYAARHPERVAGLVLADTFTTAVLGWRDRLMRALLRATIPPTRLVGYERVERAMVWLQERVQGEDVSGDYENIEAIRDAGQEMTTVEFAKVIRAVSSFHHERVDYRNIASPALVLYGEHDTAFVRRHAPVLEALLGDARVLEVPDAGHASNLDNPEFVTNALREFLDGLELRDAPPAQ